MGKRMRKKVWMTQVDWRLVDDDKFFRFTEMIRTDLPKLESLYEHAALGILIRLWLNTMRVDDTGVLSPAPEVIARQIKWVGPPPENLIKALLDCGKTSVEPDNAGFIERTPDGFKVHDWEEHQNNPVLKRETWAENKRRWRGGKAGAPPPPPAPAPDPEPVPGFGPKDESVRQILKAMKGAHITGGDAQKKQYARAWIERQGVGGAKVLELLMNPLAQGQDVFWLNTQLGGKGGPKQAEKSHTEAVDDLRKKFVEGGGK